VKLTANLPVGDYMMKEWNDFPQGADIGAARSVMQTPDQPLHATNIVWYTELMDPAEASANRSQALDNIDETHGLKAKAALNKWCSYPRKGEKTQPRMLCRLRRMGSF
jgi:hypothetical protein